MSLKLDAALALARRGFRVFPLPVDDKAIQPKDLKRPHLHNWPQLATTDHKTIRKWWKEAEYNIGLATGAGVVVLDYDMKEGQNGQRALDTHDMLGLPMDGLKVTTPTGGVHLYFKTSLNLRNSASKVAKNVDVRGDGGYVLAPGSTIHGVAYSSDKLTEVTQLDELPSWMGQLAAANKTKTTLDAKQKLVIPDEPQQIEAAKEYLNNDAPEAIQGQAGDETTYKTACRVRDFGVSQQTALELMLEWNEHKAIPPWTPDELETKVDNAYHYAQLPAGIADAKGELGDVSSLVSPSETESDKKTTKLFWVDCKEASDTALAVLNEPLVEDLFDCGGLSATYGKPGQGKTFVQLDIAFHIAAGKPWNNHPVKQGLVIYVAAEGGRMVYKRLRALMKHYQIDKQIPLALVPCPINLLDTTKDGDTRALVKLIRQAEEHYGQKAVMIVIDTLSRALAGGDENSSTDMGTFVKHLDKIRAATSAHLNVVAHSGKDQTKGLRGWSGILAALDTELEVHEQRISVTKQRDMDTIDPIQFVLKTIELGQDSRGRVATSCVVDTSQEAVARAELNSLTEQEEAVMQGIELLWTDKIKDAKNGQNPTMSNHEINERVVKEALTTSLLEKANLVRVLSKLSDVGAIKKVKRGQWVMG